MTFTETFIVKIIGAFIAAVFSYVIGKKIIIEHRTGGGWGLVRRLL